VNFQIRTAEYFFQKQFLSWCYIFAPFFETNFYYCIHQNITMDPIISQLHLTKHLQYLARPSSIYVFHIFLCLASRLFTSSFWTKFCSALLIFSVCAECSLHPIIIGLKATILFSFYNLLPLLASSYKYTSIKSVILTPSLLLFMSSA